MKHLLHAACWASFLCALSPRATAQCNPILTLTDGNVLKTTDVFFSYQWVRCPDYTSIPGATSQSYPVVTPGSYAVIVTKGSCTDTSDCMAVTPTGIRETPATKQSSVFPNPSSGQVYIKSPSAWHGAVATVYGLTGQKQLTFTLDNAEQSVRLTQGWYYIVIAKGDQREVHTVLVAE